ncbi:2-polyprenyl-6-methoxyphenol hydroxylase-like FAD-dependent oxidoreductase [Amycolatopsis echigonensis]|uniref:2-polyprenyl-6-methoxyphenol hydroxylase-like FAD-dependent oxidoreductase n=1 Tax=Amycolatopsis echigonensis TaxID=2576905 RepID=A0A2N3W9K4_9PSEU|nr:NAD(P)/FAD-dependent oxidoreductase [Amycolatopsis niigatensis]PKV90550.1 2-polyprenyl-6-methoxyphenol hydroxylase-like FAD-dependent oxidoreductase [Amycolatopsis niigatensis]
MNVLVIGGGIAGATTAMALRQAGIEAAVYEAYPKAADGVGTALTLSPNGRNALRQIDADDAVAAVGIEVPGMVMQNHRGRVVGRFDGLPELPSSLLLRRDRLYRVLMDEARSRGITVEFGKRLKSVENKADRVIAHFADGTSAAGDILVGADGIRSAVRSALDPVAPAPRYTGLLGLGGWIRNPGLPVTGSYQHFAFGKRAFFGYFIGADEILWFSNVPAADPAEAKSASPEHWLAVLRERHADDIPARDIIALLKPEDVAQPGILEDIPTVRTWHRGRVVLVGDAAHPTSPSSGQGASQAIESSLELARALRDNPDVATAFAQYEAARRERVERIIARAAKINNDKAAGPVARIMRDLLMPVMMKTVMSPEKMFGDLHRHRIEFAPSPASV